MLGETRCALGGKIKIIIAVDPADFDNFNEQSILKTSIGLKQTVVFAICRVQGIKVSYNLQ